MDGTTRTPAVLVVDDHPVNRFHVSELLRGLGRRALCAASADEALRKLQSEMPALILLDLEMPDCDGSDALHAMQQRFGAALCPVVGLTAAGADQRRLFLQQGLFDCLEKPLLGSELQELLQCNGTVHVSGNGAALGLERLPEFDWDECLRMAGGRSSHARELLTMMLETLAPCIERIQSAAAQREIPTLRQQVHYLAGSCRYCSAPRLLRLCRRLEQELSQQSTPSLRRLPQLYAAATNFAHTAGDALALLSRVSQLETDSSTTNASA